MRLVDTLISVFEDVRPEVDFVDVAFKDWGIELKTVNTNLRYEGAKNKHRPITKNVAGVIEDIEKIKKKSYAKNKAVVFVVFPAEHDHVKWQEQLKRVKNKLESIEHREFEFSGKVPGIIYFGKI